MTVAEGQRKLTVLWSCGGILALIVLIIQSIFNYWTEHVSDAWNWLLPTISPTLGLIISTAVAEALKGQPKEKVVQGMSFHLAFWLSALYLICVFVVLLGGNFLPANSLQLIKLSGLWMGPIQGLLSGLIGVFFVQHRG